MTLTTDARREITARSASIDPPRRSGSTRDRRGRRGLAVLVVITSLSACSGGGGSGGPAKLALGTEAVVAYSVPASGDVAAVDTTLGVTVLAVRLGTQAELAAGGFKIEQKDQSATPYYVDARFSNKGPGAAVRNMSVGMEDTKGNSIPTTLVFSLGGDPFEQCKGVQTGAFQPGDSYQSCTLVLAPKGSKPGRVRFVSQGSGPKAPIVFTDWSTT